MKTLSADTFAGPEDLFLDSPLQPTPIAFPSVIDAKAQSNLQRMFRDPRVLEPEERKDLIVQLRQGVELAPNVPELRVLLGMALCVDLRVQEALEELRESARQAPESFIARLKFGELLMRLRICGQAEEETHQAALLARNNIQSELARRQASAIRAMLRDGVERGGPSGFFARIFRFRRKSPSRNDTPILIHPR